MFFAPRFFFPALGLLPSPNAVSDITARVHFKSVYCFGDPARKLHDPFLTKSWVKFEVCFPLRHQMRYEPLRNLVHVPNRLRAILTRVLKNRTNMMSYTQNGSMATNQTSKHKLNTSSTQNKHQSLTRRKGNVMTWGLHNGQHAFGYIPVNVRKWNTKGGKGHNSCDNFSPYCIDIPETTKYAITM